MNDNELDIWKERFTAQKASGLPVLEWCEKNNITKHTYYYWYKQIKDSKPKSGKLPPPTFGEVNLHASKVESSGIKLSFKNVEISLLNKTDIELAVAVIHELQKTC
jgi:hypothetical protein